jgi:hypothetical protein
VGELEPLHPRNDTFPGEVFLHVAADALDWCGARRAEPLALEGMRERFGFTALTVALSGRVLAFKWAGDGVLWRAERQTVVRIVRPALCDRTEGALGRRRHPGDPDSRPAVVPAATPRDSGPIRLNLPVSAPVLPVCHDDVGWCVGPSTFEHSPVSLVLT